MTPANHKKLGIACLPLLRQACPGENLAYFLLGNWFTDVSQGIAPVDYAAGMADARKEGVAAAKKGSWFLRWLVPDSVIEWQAGKFVKQLLGDPSPQQSAMARWFRDAVFVAGWIEFCWPKGPAKDLAAQGAGPLPFEEYDRIYHGNGVARSGGRFTQYYPHEHFDRWPMDRPEKSPDRRVYAYLDDHIRNIAELLTLVQRDWARNRSDGSPRGEQRRHDLLCEFGYAMHTAEDYWAHTNYVDFAMRSIGSLPADQDELRKQERRVLRDRTPRTEMFAEPGPTEPETHVVGGYFDGIDTRFSLVQLYKGMKETLAKRTHGAPVGTADWREAKTREERERYKATMALQQTAMGMPQKVRDAELAFIELDWKMIDEWDGKCVSWVLEKMLNEGKEYGARTFGDGSRYAERIGSHTLIAKDDETKQPGFAEAMNVARAVDGYVVGTMVKAFRPPVRPACRSGSAPGACNVIDERIWVDWLDLLRYFLGHPAEAREFRSRKAPALVRDVASARWWMSAMGGVELEHDHSLKYVTAAEADRRAQLETRRKLEQEHNSMIKVESAAYEADYSGDGHRTQETKILAAKGMHATYEHDDMDRGTVRIRCLAGEVKVELSAAVWYTFEPCASGSAQAGEIWSGDFKELSGTYDQTNRCIITAEQDRSQYEIMMVSYDR